MMCLFLSLFSPFPSSQFPKIYMTSWSIENETQSNQKQWWIKIFCVSIMHKHEMERYAMSMHIKYNLKIRTKEKKTAGTLIDKTINLHSDLWQKVKESNIISYNQVFIIGPSASHQIIWNQPLSLTFSLHIYTHVTSTDKDIHEFNI